MNANQVFHWRKLILEDRLDEALPSTELVPLWIADESTEQIRPPRCYGGTIQIELRGARVRIEGSIRGKLYSEVCGFGGQVKGRYCFQAG